MAIPTLGRKSRLAFHDYLCRVSEPASGFREPSGDDGSQDPVTLLVTLSSNNQSLTQLIVVVKLFNLFLCLWRNIVVNITNCEKIMFMKK